MAVYAGLTGKANEQARAFGGKLEAGISSA
jgi:hypothetical protein